jgi:hypothetical protein
MKFIGLWSHLTDVKKRRRVELVPLEDLEPKTDDKPGPDSAGQSGDDQGLSGVEEGDSESVRELVDEGQAYEASIIQGVEDAPDADVAEVRTHQLRMDDVPAEYLDDDQPEDEK